MAGQSGDVTRRAFFGGAAAVAAGVALATAVPEANASPVASGGAPGAVPGIGPEVFVDPERGDDGNDGRAPAAQGPGHGPVQSLERATALAYEEAAATASGSVNVWLRGGTYRRGETWMVPGRADDVPIAFRAYGSEKPVLSGSEVISGWQESVLNGVRVWVTTLPDVQAGDWSFKQLFVDGVRRPRPRLPKRVNKVLENGAQVTDTSEYFYIAAANRTSGLSDYYTFEYAGSDIDPDWYDLQNVEVVLFKDWMSERSPIASVDASQHTCRMQYRPWRDQLGLRYYYVENVREALTEPGEWYLDEASGQLYYVPRKGEKIGSTVVTAPRVSQLVNLAGTESSGVPSLEFDHITFEETDRLSYTALNQAAARAEGAIAMTYAQDCTFSRCTVQNVGGYGIALEGGCTGVTVTDSLITQVGAGGVKIDSSSTGLSSPNDLPLNSGATISRNTISHYGRLFHMGVGVLSMDSPNNLIELNEISDAYYTGVSLGWTWSFAANRTHDNIVRQNHIHDLGAGLLTDMGGVYSLGVQAGTIVEGNLIENIFGQPTAPNAGLYADAGSSEIVWRENVVQNTDPAFFINPGGGNTLENNILFAGAGTGLGRGAPAAKTSPYPDEITINKNVIIVDGSQVASATLTVPPAAGSVNLVSDHNLIYNMRGSVDAMTWTEPNAIKVVDGDTWLDVPGTVGAVDLGKAKPGGFAFTTLRRPVQLEAGKTYFVVTRVPYGGHYASWYSVAAVQPAADPVVQLAGSVNGNPYGPVYSGARADGGSFGPVDMQYSTGQSGPVSTLFQSISYAGASVRNDYGGWVGIRITVGPDPIWVRALGRLRVDQTCWDQWTADGLDAHSLVVDRQLGRGRVVDKAVSLAQQGVGFAPILEAGGRRMSW